MIGVKTSKTDAKFKKDILDAMSDDLNISVALAILDEMVNNANAKLDNEPKNRDFKQILVSNLEFVKELLGILYIDEFKWFQWGVDDSLKQEISVLIDQRNMAKKDKNFILADQIRDKLTNMDISIMDTPNGTMWEKV